MALTDQTEAERYRKMFLNAVSENEALKLQIAEEVRQKYIAYRRIAELTAESFDIESPDPEERSWYYDGDGTKRKKDEQS